MLLGILGAALRQNHNAVYMLFIIGFLCTAFPYLRKNFGSIIKYVPFIIIPILATRSLLPIPQEWPGLIRLASTLVMWSLILIGLFAILSLFSRKHLNSHERK